MSLDKRPLPAREDALAFAKEMVPQARWETIAVAEGSTSDGGDGILLRECADCWILSYRPSLEHDGEEKLWLDKTTGVAVKMSLED